MIYREHYVCPHEDLDYLEDEHGWSRGLVCCDCGDLVKDLSITLEKSSAERFWIRLLFWVARMFGGKS